MLATVPARAQTIAPSASNLRPSASRVAMERARQLEAQGIPALAAVQFREAVEQSPTSVEAARELARFYSRQKRTEEAAEAWRQVLFLKHGTDPEATTQLRAAQSQLLSQSEDLPASGAAKNVRLAAKTASKITNQDGFDLSVMSAAQTLPRVAQTAPLPGSTAPLTPTNPVATPSVPDAAPLIDTPAAPTEAPPVFDAGPPTPDVTVPTVLDAAPLPVATPRPTIAPATRTVAAPPRVLPRSPVTTKAAPIAGNANAIPFVAPAKVTRRVSKVTAAKAWPFVNRAAKELTAGRAASALKLYQQAYAIDPNNPYAAPGVGTSYIVLGRFSEAAATYRAFLALAPGNAKGLRGLADALTFGKKYREALGVNNAILAKSSKDFAANYQNGQILTYLKAYKQSDAYFQSASALASSDSARANVAVAWGESLSYRRDPRALGNFQRALSLQPNNSRALLGLGNYYAYTNQFDLAIPRLRAALSQKPGDAAIQTSLGDALTYSGQPGSAVPLYRAALQKQPSNDAARLGLGRSLVYAGQSKEGAAQLVRFLSANPGNAPALEALALAQSDFAPSAALESYQTLLSREGNALERAKILANIGDLQARGNNFTGASDSYAQATKLAPSDNKIAFSYAQLLATQERFTEARPVLEGVVARQPNNVQALALQVLVENRSGNPELAKTLAANLENTAPANVDEALSLADALRATGNIELANRVLSRAVGTATDAKSALRLADATSVAGDYPGAIALYQKILASDSKNLDARLGLAQTQIYARDFDTAQEQIKQILVIDPNNVQAGVLGGQILLSANTPESRDAAANAANAALASDPNNTDAKVLLGEVLTSRQRFADAISQFRSAVEVEPNNLSARLGLARNLYYSRDIEGSISAYRELIRRLPTETLPRLELAQIFLDRNRFSESEALFNEVLAMRGGLPASATARWRVETRTYAKLSPLSSINPLQTGKRAKPHRVTVYAPAKTVSATPQKRDARISLIQLGGAAGGAAGGANGPATTSGVTPPPSAPVADLTVNDVPATAPVAPVPVEPIPADPILVPPIPADPIPADPTPLAPVAPVESAPVPATPDLGALTPPETPAASAPLAAAMTPLVPDAATSDSTTALRGLGEIRRRQGRFGESLGYFDRALTIAPNDLAAQLGKAQALRGQGKYADALQQTEGVLSVDSTNLPARVLRAQLLGDTGQADAAQKELDSLVSSLPDNAPLETYLTLSQAFNTLRQYPASLQLLDAATQLYPTEPSVPRLRAETLTFARRGPEAVAIYDQLIAADPQDADAVLGKARVYNYADQLDLAEPTYRQVLSIQPENYQAQTELADVLGRRANYTDSIALYQTAIAANPTDLATRVELARVQRYSGATSDAEATLNSVIETDANNVPALTERGVLRGTLGSYAPAIADLNAALAISPNDPDAQIGLAEVQSYAGDYPASVAAYRAVLVNDPQNLKARTGLGVALGYSNQTPEALKELDAVLTQNPGDLSARLAKADVLARATRTDEAITLYNGVLASNPDSVRARTGLADAYLYGRNYPAAVKVYDALIAANPTNSTYKIQRARALGYDGRAKEAVTTLRTIVQAEPNNLPARLALAEAGTNSGNPALLRDAVADYRSILSTDSSNVPAQVGLARALSYRGSYGEAKSRLNTVLAANPGNTDARLALAETQRFAGNDFDAKSNYNRVLETQPGNTAAKRGRRIVDRVTSPTLTLGGSSYNDTNGVRLRSFNPGFLYPTKAGTLGILAERGRFSQGGSDRDRNAISGLIARNFGPVQARLVLTRLKYDGAPSRTLYDLLLNNVRGPRQRYYLNVAKRDIFESDAAVVQGITATFARAGLTYPLGNKFDFEAQATRYRYSDRNNRTSAQGAVYYRFRPTSPSIRIGVGQFYDNTAETRNAPFTYYTPQTFNATSILADYVVDQGDTRYGVFGAYPLTGRTGDNGINRPAKTLFGFVNHDLNDMLELFAQGGIVRSPDFRSNQVSAGVNVHF